MDGITSASVSSEPSLLLGFLFRLFFWRIEMGLRARLDAMESQSTAQQWKRQRLFGARSGLASLCSADCTSAHSAEGCRIVLESNYHKQKDLLNRLTSSSRLQGSVRSAKRCSNQPRFLLEDAPPFNPLGIVQLGLNSRNQIHTLNSGEDLKFPSFQPNEDGSSIRIASGLRQHADTFPKLTAGSAAATLLNTHGTRRVNCPKDFSAAATLVDMQSANPEKSYSKDFSAAVALVDMQVAKSDYHANVEGVNLRLISREPSSHVDVVTTLPEKQTSKTLAAAQQLDMIVSEHEHGVAVKAANTSPISGGGVVLSSCDNKTHRRALTELETSRQVAHRVLAPPNNLSASNIVDEVPKQEPLYKQLLERRHADDIHVRHLNSEIKTKEILWENLQRTRLALFKLRRRAEVQKPTPTAFTPLSEEEELEVQHALNGGNRQEVLVQHQSSNIDLSRGALQCLKPGAWLNDEVINLYMELLKERECRDQKNYLKCHFFNTFFFNKLFKDASSYDYKAVRRWTTLKKLGYSLLQCDKIFVPIHKDIHWCLAVINLREKKLQYLDSLKGQDLNALHALARYITDEAKDKGLEIVDTSSWKLDCPQDIPEQMNGCDCGMFMIKYADFLSQGDDLKFSQENMEHFRKQTILELLQLKAR